MAGCETEHDKIYHLTPFSAVEVSDSCLVRREFDCGDDDHEVSRLDI
jgi:hypothetical protein